MDESSRPRGPVSRVHRRWRTGRGSLAHFPTGPDDPDVVLPAGLLVLLPYLSAADLAVLEDALERYKAHLPARAGREQLTVSSLLTAVREARYQSRPPPERGVVTMFVVALVAAMLALGGLVIDGGALLAAKRRAINEAEGAARAGAQELSEPALREGRHVLDPAAARSAVAAYLAAAGHDGTVLVGDDQVSVTVTITADLAILTMIDPTVTGSGSARAVRGVRSADEP